MIRKQSVLNIIISYCGLGFSFFNTLLKTKALSPSEIGIVSLIITIAGILYYFVAMGIPSIILKYYPEHNKSKSEQKGFILYAFSSVIILFIVASFIMLLAKNMLIGPVIDKALSNFYIYILGFLFVDSLFYTGDSVLRARLKTVYPNFLKNLVNNILHFILIVYILLSASGLILYIQIYLLIKMLTLLILIILIVREFPFHISPTFRFFTLRHLSEYYKYGLIMIISIFSMTLVYRTDIILLMKFSTLENIGIYSIAVVIGSIIRTVGVSVNRIVHPRIAQIIYNNQTKELESLYKRSVLINLLFGVFILLCFLFFAPQILTLLGSAYIAGVAVVMIIAIGEFINISSGMCGGIIVFSDYYKYDLILNILLLIMNITMNLLLIPVWGINGAAISTATSVAVYNIIKLIMVYRKFGIHPFSFRYLRIIFNGLIVAVFMFAINSISGLSPILTLIIGIGGGLILQGLLNMKLFINAWKGL